MRDEMLNDIDYDHTLAFSRAATLSHVLIIWDALCSTYRSTSTRAYIYFRYPGSVLKLWRKYSSGTEGKMKYMYSRAVLVTLMQHKNQSYFQRAQVVHVEGRSGALIDKACPSKHTVYPYSGSVYSKNILRVSSVVWPKSV